MDNPTVKEVASKHSKAAAEVSLLLFVYGSWKAQGSWLHSYNNSCYVVFCLWAWQRVDSRQER